jgi:hypothetical protein
MMQAKMATHAGRANTGNVGFVGNGQKSNPTRYQPRYLRIASVFDLTCSFS